MVRAFYKGNRISWMEDILPRDTVEKYLMVEFFSNTKPVKCAVHFRAFSEYLEGLEDSSLPESHT